MKGNPSNVQQKNQMSASSILLRAHALVLHLRIHQFLNIKYETPTRSQNLKIRIFQKNPDEYG